MKDTDIFGWIIIGCLLGGMITHVCWDMSIRKAIRIGSYAYEYQTYKIEVEGESNE